MGRIVLNGGIPNSFEFIDPCDQLVGNIPDNDILPPEPELELALLTRSFTLLCHSHYIVDNSWLSCFSRLENLLVVLRQPVEGLSPQRRLSGRGALLQCVGLVAADRVVSE